MGRRGRREELERFRMRMRRKFARCWWRRGQARGGLLRWLRRLLRLSNRTR